MKRMSDENKNGAENVTKLLYIRRGKYFVKMWVMYKIIFPDMLNLFSKTSFMKHWAHMSLFLWNLPLMDQILWTYQSPLYVDII